MDVSIGERWQGFVNDAVEDGRFDSADQMVQEGLRLLQEREAKLKSLRDTLAASIARGGSHTDDEIGIFLSSRQERRRPQQAAE